MLRNINLPMLFQIKYQLRVDKHIQWLHRMNGVLVPIGLVNGRNVQSDIMLFGYVSVELIDGKTTRDH